MSDPVIEIYEAEEDPSEAESLARGFVRQYSVRGEWPRDENDPADEPFFRLAAGQYVPVRGEGDWWLPSWDAALELAASYEARGATKIVISETGAYLVECMAAERAFEGRVG